MEKRFKKVVKNPETGRTRTVRYGQAGKATEGIGFAQARPRGMRIALVPPRSRVTGSQTQTARIICLGASGSAVEANL